MTVDESIKKIKKIFFSSFLSFVLTLREGEIILLETYLFSRIIFYCRLLSISCIKVSFCFFPSLGLSCFAYKFWRFVEDVAAMRDIEQVDYIVLNAVILKYPNVNKYFFSLVACNEMLAIQEYTTS